MSEEMKTMEAAAAATVDTREAEMPVLILPAVSSSPQELISAVRFISVS